MVVLGCQETDWVDKNNKELLDEILLRDGLIPTKENLVILGVFLVGLGSQGGPLRSQMVDLGCQDTDRVGGNDKDVSDAILPHTSQFEHG